MATYNFSAELYDNPLTEKEGDFTARPTLSATLHNKEIAKRIVEKRTEYRLETIINILDLADQEKAMAIAEGKSVVDGVGQYMVNIKGVFESATAKFDPKVHSLGVSYNPGSVIRKFFEDTAVNVTKVATTGPVIGKATDLMSATVNDKLTPGKIIQVNGSNIKVVGTDDGIGLFFVTEDGKTAAKSELIATNIPSELTALIPALADGLYRIRVVTQYASGAKQTKDARTAEFPILFTVGNGGNENPDDL